MAKGQKTGGRQKGTPNKATVDKEFQRERVRQLVSAQLEPLVRAQLHNAMGIGHLMLRDPETGKFERVVTTGDAQQDEAVIDAAVKQGRQQCWVYLKDPSIQAFSDLLNRALDKPAEQMKVTGADDGPVKLEFVWKRKSSK